MDPFILGPTRIYERRGYITVCRLGCIHRLPSNDTRKCYNSSCYRILFSDKIFNLAGSADWLNKKLYLIFNHRPKQTILTPCRPVTKLLTTLLDLLFYFFNFLNNKNIFFKHNSYFLCFLFFYNTYEVNSLLTLYFR